MPKISRAEGAVALLIFILVAAAYLIRGFFGVSVGDEAQYVAIADFPRMGAQWFADEITIQTTSAILISPFISAYTRLFGTTGVFLFSRGLYLISSLGVAVVVARFFSRYCRRPVALIMGATLVAFVPHGMSCLTYNSIGSQYFGLGCMMALLGIWENSARWSFAAGIAWVICVFGYPTMILNFALFIAVMSFTFWRREGFFTTFIRPFSIGLVLPSAALVAVLLSAGLGNVVKAVEICRHFNMPFSLYKIPFGLSLLASYLPPWWMLVCGLVAWLTLARFSPGNSYLGLAALSAAYIFFGGPSEGSFLAVFWPLFQLLGIVTIALGWRSWSTDLRTLVVTFYAPALIGSFVTMLTSRLTVYNMSNTALFSSLAVVALVARGGRAAGWILATGMLAYTVILQWPHFYEDGRFTSLDYVMRDGPYKFLRTNRAKGELLDAVQTDLKALPASGTVFFQDHFPVGYLMTDLKFNGPTVNMLPAFLHPESRPIFFEMFIRNPQYWADFVVEFRRFPMAPDNVFYYRDSTAEEPQSEFFKRDQFYNFFARRGIYRILVDREVYRILRRN